jgi:hypothetical protein
LTLSAKYQHQADLLRNLHVNGNDLNRCFEV